MVEESPSCMVKPETRRAMQKQAIALCRAVGYRSAGTIEMLCDEQQNFFFLEMNTRLQVEHPVTELVSGEDLVEHMLWIAAGKKLPDRLLTGARHEDGGKRDGYLDNKGYAIESRVYAEDPVRNFLPAIGPLVAYMEPRTHVTPDSKGEGVTTIRVDSGVYEGGAISPHYDPMIAKLCSHHSHSRSVAISAMNTALDEYVIRGVVNNLAFLRAIYRDPVFNKGLYSTKFIGQQFPAGFTRVMLDDGERHRLLAVAAAIHCSSSTPSKDQLVDHENDSESDEMVMERRELVLVMEDEADKAAYKVKVSIGEGLTAVISPVSDSKGKGVKVTLNDLQWLPDQPIARALFSSSSSSSSNSDSEGEGEGESCAVQLMGRAEDGLLLRLAGADHRIAIRSPLEHRLSAYMREPPAVDFSRSLLSPMPGTLVALSVVEGQRVEPGQQLAVVEAMKMQSKLAPSCLL